MLKINSCYNYIEYIVKTQILYSKPDKILSLIRIE